MVPGARPSTPPAPAWRDRAERRRRIAVSVLAPILVAATDVPSSLDPRSAAAASVTQLWWVMFGLGVAVFVLVVTLTAVALARRREAPVEGDALTGERLLGGGNMLVLAGGVALPVVVVVGLAVAMVNTGAGVRLLGTTPPATVVEVTGWQFWWDVVYPGEGVRVANEIHVPVGEPVDFRIMSGDVIHSWWVPQLGGRMDMSPGEVNEVRVQAEEPGVYRGICTEYCGIQHAHMHFLVVAHPADEFDRWLAERAEPPDPDDAAVAEGRQVFIDAGCGECHTIEGVSPRNDNYPDLTHLADRRTIAGGMLANTRGNLGGWVLDPQAIKPGNRMPPANLDGDELTALLDYLESLE